MNHIQLVLLIALEKLGQRAYQGFQPGRVAQIGGTGNHIQTDALASGQTFAAQTHHVHFNALVSIFLHLRQEFFQNVGIQTAAQAFVGGHQDKTGTLHTAVRFQQFDAVVGMGLRQMAHHQTHFFGVRTRQAHPLLSLPHFRG